MPIPQFDKTGNIPIGDLFKYGSSTPLIATDLAELKDRFVAKFPKSSTRLQVWDGWMQHRTEFAGTGLTYATLIGGSFVTGKGDPNDVDLCIILEAQDLNDLSASDPMKFVEVGRLVDTKQAKPKYHCDTYALRTYPVRHPRFFLMAYAFNYWTRVFGIDRKGKQKAVLYLPGGGVL